MESGNSIIVPSSNMTSVPFVAKLSQKTGIKFIFAVAAAHSDSFPIQSFFGIAVIKILWEQNKNKITAFFNCGFDLRCEFSALKTLVHKNRVSVLNKLIENNLSHIKSCIVPVAYKCIIIVWSIFFCSTHIKSPLKLF